MPPTRALLHRLLYFPARAIAQTPAAAGLPFRDLSVATGDGQSLQGWWVPAPSPAIGHVLLCHGNAGNIGDRVPHVELLRAVGLDVLAFDYRGYGRSTGRPSEPGLRRDAVAALEVFLAQDGVDPQRVLYLGESLGGAVALALALERPPAGLILQSAFTSIRDLARLHYPFIPPALVPDAYPSLDLIAGLAAPLQRRSRSLCEWTREPARTRICSAWARRRRAASARAGRRTRTAVRPAASRRDLRARTRRPSRSVAVALPALAAVRFTLTPRRRSAARLMLRGATTTRARRRAPGPAEPAAGEPGAACALGAAVVPSAGPQSG
jgi:uncharacterized protein